METQKRKQKRKWKRNFTLCLLLVVKKVSRKQNQLQLTFKILVEIKSTTWPAFISRSSKMGSIIVLLLYYVIPLSYNVDCLSIFSCKFLSTPYQNCHQIQKQGNRKQNNIVFSNSYKSAFQHWMYNIEWANFFFPEPSCCTNFPFNFCPLTA